MELAPRSLRRLADDVDQRHRTAMSTFHDEVTERHRGVVDASRRRFLIGTTVAAGALSVGAALGPTRLLSPAAAQSLTDEDLAAFAQSVELAAVQAYGAAAPALSAGTRPVALLFQQHHQQHADAFGAVAKGKAVKTANAKLLAALAPALAAMAAAVPGTTR